MGTTSETAPGCLESLVRPLTFCALKAKLHTLSFRRRAELCVLLQRMGRFSGSCLQLTGLPGGPGCFSLLRTQPRASWPALPPPHPAPAGGNQQNSPPTPAPGRSLAPVLAAVLRREFPGLWDG